MEPSYQPLLPGAAGLVEFRGVRPPGDFES
jgi:hypothetical protein